MIDTSPTPTATTAAPPPPGPEPRRTGGYRGRRARTGQPGGRRRLLTLAVPLLLAAVVTASAPGLIRVHSGDTLWALARAHHTSVGAIQQANHLSGDRIYAGQLLRIPGTGAASATAGARPSVGYTVRHGDTIGALALRFRTSEGTLIALNHLRSDGFIRVGQRLAVPGTAPAAPRTTASPHRASSTVERHRAYALTRPQPSKATVRAMVSGTARRYGVDPSLAMAIALQESGFQQAVVSGDDAIGVMQLLPGTASWVAADLAGRRLDPFDAADNITGGVLLLRSLLRAAPLSTAIGAYYQGLGSIRSRGMYDDTKAYVHAVLANRTLFR